VLCAAIHRLDSKQADIKDNIHYSIVSAIQNQGRWPLPPKDPDNRHQHELSSHTRNKSAYNSEQYLQKNGRRIKDNLKTLRLATNPKTRQSSEHSPREDTEKSLPLFV
jgi:hypothetical protein